MDIGGMSSAYTDYLSSQSTASKLDTRIQTKDYAKSSDEQLLDSCKEFEAYFLEQIFKEMQKTVDVLKDKESGKDDSMMSYFKDSAIQDLASTSTAKDGLGLAQMLYEQMKRNYNI